MGTVTSANPKFTTPTELHEMVKAIVGVRLDEEWQPGSARQESELVGVLVDRAVAYTRTYATWLAAWLALVDDASNKTAPTEEDCAYEDFLMVLHKEASTRLENFCLICGVSYTKLLQSLEELCDVQTTTEEDEEAKG